MIGDDIYSPHFKHRAQHCDESIYFWVLMQAIYFYFV